MVFYQKVLVNFAVHKCFIRDLFLSFKLSPNALNSIFHNLSQLLVIMLVTRVPYFSDRFWVQDPPLEECNSVKVAAPLDPLLEDLILDLRWYNKNHSTKLVNFLIA